MDLDVRRESLEEAAFHSDTLHVAFVGLADGLIGELEGSEPTAPGQLATETGVDRTYLERWLEAAHAHELVDYRADRVELTDFGAAFLPEADDTLMPLAVQSILSPRLADRLSELMRSGACPGESILEEFENVVPWFGRMLEAKFRPVFREKVRPALSIYDRLDERGVRILDLGCGNGWYLRELAESVPGIEGMGIDTLQPNISGARRKAEEAGVDGRLAFQVADLFEFRPDQTYDIVALNRTLHHVWARRDALWRTVDAVLDDAGRLLIWEPAWPEQRDALRTPRRRGLGMRNLAEHAMGNRLLGSDEVVDWIESHGLTAEVRAIDEVETIFVARR